jgi:energy-converting hydrogenase Eha subunit F
MKTAVHEVVHRVQHNKLFNPQQQPVMFLQFVLVENHQANLPAAAHRDQLFPKNLRPAQRNGAKRRPARSGWIPETQPPPISRKPQPITSSSKAFSAGVFAPYPLKSPKNRWRKRLPQAVIEPY